MGSIASNVTELELADGARIFISPTKAKDVVTVRGSVLGGWNMLPHGRGDIQTLAVELMDAGTSTKSKDQIREALSDRGINLSFSAGGDRTYFSGSCLPENLGFLLETVVECLTGANFPAKEIALAKERALGEWEESRTDTKLQASIALQRELYNPTHFNYAYSIDERITQTKSVTRTELLTFRKTLGRKGLILAIAGDVALKNTERVVRMALAKLPEGTATVPVKKLNTKSPSNKETLIPIKDKANIDVFIGAATPFTIDHPLYLAFALLMEMLGARGLSAGHLMRTIRERDGLTYGIYAQLFGFSDGTDGAMRIWATFSPATYKKAVAATRAEIAVFLKTLVTRDALLKIQDRISGSYIVSLSTTEGLANMLHMIGRDGKALSYMDTYPDLVRSVTIEDLVEVMKLVPFNSLSLAASGSFQK
ncbi:MAG: zinc protease [Parcubacteria bacterium C7867-007]|nr:MAG: zinc protease [Parcubacteria bacterium C7867-007]